MDRPDRLPAQPAATDERPSDRVRDAPEVPLGRLWGAVLCGYLAFGATLQALPGYVTTHFRAGETAAGWAVGVAFAATALCRPWAGRAGDAGLSRPVVLTGGILIALGGLGHLLAPALWVLLVARVVMGAGEAALFSAALPWVLTATAPERRGRVAGWFGLSMWGGLAAGPLVAVAASAVSQVAVWPAVLALGVIAAALVATTSGGAPVCTPARRRGSSAVMPRRWRDLVPVGAAVPGIGFGLSAYGYGTITTLLVLYLTAAGHGGQNLALAVFAAAFLAARALASSHVDRHGGGPVALVVLAVEALGLALIAASPSPWVALPGAALTGIGVSLMFPATVAMTLGRTGPLSPGTSVGVMTSFWDLGILVAGPASGAIAAAHSPAPAFAVAALTSIAALAVAAGLIRKPSRASRPS